MPPGGGAAPPRRLRVAAVQFEHAPGDKAANMATVRRFAAAAARERVEVLAFPECCLTGYMYLKTLGEAELRALAEPVPVGPATQELLRLSRELRMTIGAGLVEAGADGGLHNSYVVAMPDGAWRRHRKLHTFVSPHMRSGDEYTVFDTPHGVRLGVLICYDNNIGENVRITALKGAEVLLAPHQTGGCYSGNPHKMQLIDERKWMRRHEDPAAIEAELRGPSGRGWITRWLPARAHDNGLFIVFANGVGRDGDEIRTGNAMVIDPYGRIIEETAHAGDRMVIADLDLALREGSAATGWLRARRPELYGPLTERTGREVDVRVVKWAPYDARDGTAAKL